MWFDEIATVENPGRRELDLFVEGAIRFLNFVLEANEFAFLWEQAQGLRDLAFDSYRQNVQPSAIELRRTIPNISEDLLRQHGLLGLPLRFKLGVVGTLGRKWERVRGKLSIRDWFSRIVQAIDAILDSLISAAGGVGGLIKEFKDALAALAPIRE